MRDPNGPIGVDDYRGRVGFEKHDHQTHWGVDWHKFWKSGKDSRWEEYRPGKYRLVLDKTER